MTSTQITSSLKESVVRRAMHLGFDLVRIASPEPLVEDGAAAQERVRQGFMEGMPWFNQERVQQACDPQALLPGVRSIVAVALSYLPPEQAIPNPLAVSSYVELAFPPPSSPSPFKGEGIVSSGKVARYARWVDYHEVMKAKLRALAADLPQLAGRPVRSRVFVDDSPLLERAVARRAGLGWFGKNTNILTSTHGSWVFLGALLTNLELEPDEPLKKGCGDCVRCIPACPTGAIVAPYVIDARQCISYLTIECRGPIPRHLRPQVGDWVFGCDLCQEVCPVNQGLGAGKLPGNGSGKPLSPGVGRTRTQSGEGGWEKPPRGGEVEPPSGGLPTPSILKRTGFSTLELEPLLTMTPEEFSARFANTPIKRAKLRGLQRNACVALGNLRDPRSVPALGMALQTGEPLVRGHAAWALGRIGGPEAQRWLGQALEGEASAEVREEIEAALASIPLNESARSRE